MATKREKQPYFVLTCRNYFGIGMNSSIHRSYTSAEDEALGRGKWARETPLKHYAITGPYDKVPPLTVVRGEEAVSKLPLGPADR